MLEKMSELPKTPLWQYPTPIETLPNLARDLGAHRIWVKRDDYNGLAFGGNKVRQMEYYLGDALAIGADTLLITGAVQSNFVRIAAAACAKHGLECHVQLEARVVNNDPAYNVSGNVLLDQMLGASLHHFPVGEDEAAADRNLETIADRLTSEGRRPYVVHLHPSHPPLGALGYIDAARETIEQMQQQNIQPEVIFVPSGSGNTHGGFLYGLRALGFSVPVKGVCVRREAERQHPRMVERLQQIATLLEEISPANEEDIEVDDRFLAPGYGKAGEEVKRTISMAAQKEALILDPVYTGKTFAAAFDYVQENPGCSILVLHTGGSPSIFGYSISDLVPVSR